MAINDGDIIKAVWEQVLNDGTIAQNVFHFIANLSEEVPSTTALTILAPAIDAMYQNVQAIVDANCVVNPMVLHKVAWNATEQAWETIEYIGQYLGSFAATGTGDAFPNQIAPTVTGDTNRPQSRGRKFLAGMVESVADGSDLTAAAISAISDWAADYIADVQVGQSGVFSPGVVRAAVNEFLAFTVANVNSIVGTQRRRKPGVGV